MRRFTETAATMCLLVSSFSSLAPWLSGSRSGNRSRRRLVCRLRQRSARNRKRWLHISPGNTRMPGVSPGRLRLSDRCASRITPTCFSTKPIAATRWSAELDPSQWRWRYYRALIQSERGGGESLVENLRRVVESGARFRSGVAAARRRAVQGAEVRRGARRHGSARVRRARRTANQPAPRHVTEVPLSAYANVGLARIALVQGETIERARRSWSASPPTRRSSARRCGCSPTSIDRSAVEADAERLVYRANRLQPFAPYLDPMVDDLARESRNSTLLLRVSSEANLAVNAEWAEYLTRRALEFDPDNPEAVVKLGRVLRTIGRNEEALEFFQRYHQMVPGDFLGLAHIGSCLSAMGRYRGGGVVSPARGRRASTIRRRTTTSGLLLSMTGRSSEAIARIREGAGAGSDARRCADEHGDGARAAGKDGSARRAS